MLLRRGARHLLARGDDDVNESGKVQVETWPRVAEDMLRSSIGYDGHAGRMSDVRQRQTFLWTHHRSCRNNRPGDVGGGPASATGRRYRRDKLMR